MLGRNWKLESSKTKRNEKAKPSPSVYSRMVIMSSIPEDLSYTAEHEWVSIENGIATIGITDYAQDALTDVVWVELPMIGDKVESMEPFASVESVKSVSEIYAPLSGEIVEVNEDLARQNPFDGEGLHLMMQDEPCDYKNGNFLLGGAPPKSNS